jgi:maltose O-acetyltransferase
VAPVKIGNNVWIGAYSTILKGVRVGDNSVITAHSVVTRDVLENCVYAGFPARPTVRDIHKKDFLQKAKKDEE